MLFILQRHNPQSIIKQTLTQWWYIKPLNRWSHSTPKMFISKTIFYRFRNWRLNRLTGNIFICDRIYRYSYLHPQVNLYTLVYEIQITYLIRLVIHEFTYLNVFWNCHFIVFRETPSKMARATTSFQFFNYINTLVL